MNLLDYDLPAEFIRSYENEEAELVEDIVGVVGDAESGVIYVDDNDLLMPEVYRDWSGEAVSFQEVSNDEVGDQSYIEGVAYENTHFEFTPDNDEPNEDQIFLDSIPTLGSALRTPYDQFETIEYADEEFLPLENSTMVVFDDMPHLEQTSRSRRKAATVVTCDVCGVLLKHPSKIEAHMRTHTGEKPFECDLCGMKFSQRTPMLNHVRRHLGQTPYDCSYGCGKKFVNNAQKNAHELRHLGSKRAGPPRPHLKPPKRPLWNKVFPEGDSRMRVCEEERSTIVNFAPPVGHIEPPLSASASKRLDEIIESVVSGVPIKKRKTRPSRAPMLVQCQICGLMLKHASKIRAHIRTHTGDKPYICVYCDEQFGTSGTLSMHIKRKHTFGERPYACTWDCGKRFVSLSTRNEHERVVHAGTKRYECSIAGCFRMFSRRYYLMLHRQREHGVFFKPIFDPEEISTAEKEADKELIAEQEKASNRSDQFLVDPTTNALVHVSEDRMVFEPDVEQHAFMQGRFVEETDSETLAEADDAGIQNSDRNDSLPDLSASRYIPSDNGLDPDHSGAVDVPLLEDGFVELKTREQLSVNGKQPTNLKNAVDVKNGGYTLPKGRVVNILKKRLPIRPSVYVRGL